MAYKIEINNENQIIQLFSNKKQEWEDKTMSISTPPRVSYYGNVRGYDIYFKGGDKKFFYKEENVRILHKVKSVNIEKTFISLISTSYPESAPLLGQSAPLPEQSAPVMLENLRKELPKDLLTEIDNLKRKCETKDIQQLIFRLCTIRAFRLQEICLLIDRTTKHTLRQYIQPIMNIQIEYLYKDMVNHPEQAYISIRK